MIMEKDAIGRPRKKMAKEKSRVNANKSRNSYLKKTRIFELIDPTPERWDIYESLIPALDESYGLHANDRIKAHLDRRTINRTGNLLTIEFYAENESDFFQIDYDAIVIYTKAGISFKMLSTVSEEMEPIEHTYTSTYQLIESLQTQEHWDRLMRVIKIVDCMGGKYGVKAERKLYPKKFALIYSARFPSWFDFAEFMWEIGRLVERYDIQNESINEIPRMYQASLFDDILELTDSKRVRSYA
jgi:hypothetical protein